MSGKEFVCFSLKQGQYIFIFRSTDICKVRIRGELLCPPPSKTCEYIYTKATY